MRWLLYSVLLGQAARPAMLSADAATLLLAQGRRYADALPRVSCEVAVRSERARFGRTLETVKLGGTLTVERTGRAEEPFREDVAWRTRDGVAVAAGQEIRVPYIAGGVFSNALGFDTPESMLCEDLKVTDRARSPQVRVDAMRKATAACAGRVPGLHKTIYLDRASGRVVRVVRQVPAAEAAAANEVPFAEVQYGLVVLGAETFSLPVRAETHDARDEGRMLVEYTGCRKFAATVTITAP